MKKLPESEETNRGFKDLVNTWMELYQISIGTLSGYKLRLKELQTWDTNTPEFERRAKRHALIRLIHKLENK